MSSEPLKWFVEVTVDENLVNMYKVMPFFAPAPLDYVNKTIGEEWTFEIPDAFDLAGEEVSVNVQRSRGCEFIGLEEQELFIDAGHKDEVIKNCTVTFTLTARGYFDEDPVRQMIYKTDIEIKPVPIPDPVSTFNYTVAAVAANSTNETVVANVTTIVQV